MSDTGKIVALVKALAPKADPAVIEAKVQEWLEDHPEATTTVQDGSITLAKLASDVAAKINQVSQLSDEIDTLDSDVTDLKSALPQIVGIIVGDSPVIDSMLAPFKVTVTDIAITKTSGKAVMANGEIHDFGSGGVSQEITLDDGALYKCKCFGVGQGGGHFVIYNSLGEISATYPALATEYKEFYFKGCKQFNSIIMELDNNNTCYIQKITLGNTIAEQLLFDNMSYVNMDITINTSKLLHSDGTVVNYPSGDTSWGVSDEVDISEYPLVKIKARSGYTNAYYALYNDLHECIGSEISPGGVTETIEKTIETHGAKYIRISRVGSQTEVYVAYPENFYYASKKWAGKKWVAIGDSLTEQNDATTKHYYDYVSDATGISLATPINDYAKGGTGYANPNGSAGNFVTRMGSVPSDADVYTIFGSFNDYAYMQTNNIPIGDADDSGTTTLCGYVNAAFDALFARVPLANLGVVAPCPWVSINSMGGGTFGHDYTQALKAVCERRSVPFLDLYTESGLRPWDTNVQAQAYSKDRLPGVHPDETGHAILAPKFEAFLEKLLMH